MDTVKTFLACDLCLGLPEGHGVLSAVDGNLDRCAELRALWSAEFEQLLECPGCGTLYRLQLTLIDTDFWAAIVDPYDIPTAPHRSMVRLAPSRGEALLAEHAGARLPAWTRHVERHYALFARALAQTPVPLDDARLRHAVVFRLDRATPDEVVALLGHADPRVALFTAQVLVYPLVTDDRFLHPGGIPAACRRPQASPPHSGTPRPAGQGIRPARRGRRRSPCRGVTRSPVP